MLTPPRSHTTSRGNGSSKDPARNGSKRLAQAETSERRPGTKTSVGSGRTTKSHGSKDRPTGTKLSEGSRRTNRSGGTDGDSTDSDLDVDTLPLHLKRSVPLHLKEARILKKNERPPEEVPADYVTTRRRGLLGSAVAATPEHDQDVDIDDDPPPVMSIYEDSCLLCVRLCLFSLWAMVVIGLLILHVYIFYTSLADSLHLAKADSILMKFEANIMQSLSTCVNVIDTLALAGNAGYFNLLESSTVVGNLVASVIKVDDLILRVQVVNAGTNKVVVRPGRTPRVSLYPVPEEKDPFLRLDVNYDLLKPRVQLPGQLQSLFWYGPEFLKQDGFGQTIADVNKWPYILRLLAQVNITSSPSQDVPVKTIGIDVGLSLEKLNNIIRSASPNPGALFIFTTEGYLLAGTNWAASPFADPTTGSLQYAQVSQLPFSWAGKLTPEVIASSEQFLGWQNGKDLVVMRPLYFRRSANSSEPPGGPELGSSALRAVIYVPRSTGVRPLLQQLIDAAIGVSATPFIIAVFALLGFSGLQLVRCCSRCCNSWSEDEYSDEDDVLSNN